MTHGSSFRRSSAALLSALGTAAVFTAALSVQHARSAWPFDRLHPTPADARPAGPSTASEVEAAHQRVGVDVAATQSLDIRLEIVRRESLSQTIRAVATVVPDESRISHVHTRVSGWIEQLAVSTTGELVRAGQPLAHIFSQELLSSQTEYLAARRNTAASGITSVVVASGRARLAVLGMTPAEIDAIDQRGEPKRLVTVVAPRTGFVVSRGVTVGTSVDPSTTLMTIADLSRVWVLAEVPEANILAVRVGTTAQLDVPASGRPPFGARVDFIYPTLTERTRTLRVRMSVANPGGTLKPGLYGTAAFQSAGEDVISVPRDAVVDTGIQQHVFVAVGNTFEPRPVTLGARLADRVEIREGLNEGEQVVAAGVFLLDSESRLRATGGAGGHQHESPSNGEPPPGASTDPHAAHKQSSATSTRPGAHPHAGHESPSANGRPEQRRGPAATE